MQRLKDQIPILSVGAVVGALIPALVSLGIFATRADLAELELRVSDNFVKQEVYNHKMNKIEKSLEKILDILYEDRVGNEQR